MRRYQYVCRSILPLKTCGIYLAIVKWFCMPGKNLPTKARSHFVSRHKSSLNKRSAKAGNARSPFVVGKCQAGQTAQIDTVVSPRQICALREWQIFAPVWSTNSIIVYDLLEGAELERLKKHCLPFKLYLIQFGTG